MTQGDKEPELGIFEKDTLKENENKTSTIKSTEID